MPQPLAKLSKKIKGKARVLTSKEHLQMMEEKEKKKKEEAELKQRRKIERELKAKEREAKKKAKEKKKEEHCQGRKGQNKRQMLTGRAQRQTRRQTQLCETETEGSDVQGSDVSSSDESVPGKNEWTCTCILYSVCIHDIVFTSSFQLLCANRGNVHTQKVSIGYPVTIAGGGTTVYV